MNYKGKTVEVDFYQYFQTKPYMTLIGKVRAIHTSQGTRDSSFITIETKEGKIFSSRYFVIKREVN